MSQPEFLRTLEQELERRCQHNPRYSLRCFARDLSMSPGRLSEVMRGRSGMSVKTAGRVAKALGFTTIESRKFVDQVVSHHSRNPTQRKLAQTRLLKYKTNSYEPILEDTLQAMKEWYHLAILELVTLPQAVHDHRWIAQCLQITEGQARLAIERLIRLQQLKLVDQKYVASSQWSATTDGIPSQTIRQFHAQILAKALQAQDLQSVEEKSYSSTVMAFNSKKMKDAQTRLKEFRRAFNEEFGGQTQANDTVYCLAMQFFKLGPAS